MTRHSAAPFASLLVLLILTFVTPTARAQQNLLADAGLEQSDSGAWTGFWSRTADAGSSERDGTVHHRGRQSLKVVHTGAEDWSVSHNTQHRVRPGDVYEMGAWLRSEGSAEVQLSVVTRDAAGEVLDWLYAPVTTSGTHDWRQVGRRIVVPPGVASIQFRLTGNGPATVWMDDAELRKSGNVSDAAAALEGKQMTLSNDVLDVQIDAPTGAMTITDKRIGRAWTQEVRSHSVVVREIAERDGAVVLRLWDVGNDLDLTATIALDGAKPELIVRLEGEGPVQQQVEYPRPFITGAGTSLVVPMNEGILFPVDDQTVATISLITYGGHGICMPWYGVTDMASGAGVMAILPTADDARIHITRAGGSNLYVQPAWEASRQSFRYAREIRFIVQDAGGYVAQAKRYRQYAKDTGLLVTLTEKRQRNEDVDLLIGAANIWNWDMDAGELCAEMKDLGMERILWSRGGSAEQLARINDLGMLSSRYDIYQDVMDPAQFDKLRWTHGDWTTPAWPEDLMRRADGEWVRGWEVEAKDGSMIPCGVLCDRQAPPYARQRIAEELKTKPYRSRFIDTTTASPWRECYDPDHPMTRTESREWKMKLLEVVSEEFNLVTGCETGHDASVPYLHFFEGMLSLGPYRVEDSGRGMLDYKPPTPELIKYQVGPYYRVPLWELVYHDCVVSTWYWGDYNNKLPEFWPQRDLFNLLYGTPPMYMFDREKWARDKQRFVESYERVCPTVRQVGYDEMLSHEFLTADHTVQRTRFSGGTEVVVNFGEEPHTLADGTTVESMGHVVRAAR